VKSSQNHEFLLTFESGKQWIYNNMTNALTDLDGNNVVDNLEPGEFTDAEIAAPWNPIAKSNAPRTLKIQLGLKCNYSCAYCNQATQVGDEFHTNTDDAEDFINRLDTWLESEPQKIELWGGEPWLYWKKIKYLLPRLRERFPNAKFGMITNGSLLNQEIMDMIDEYDISITISHDGPGQYLRGPDPLVDDEKRAWIDQLVEKRQGNLCFNTVLTADNRDPNKVKNFFKKEFGPQAHSDFEGIVNDYSDGDVGLVREFCQEEYDELSQSILSGLYQGELMQTSYFGGRLVNFIEGIRSARPASSVGQKCGMDASHNIAVDLLGNAMTCQNTGAKGLHNIGNVYRGDVAIDTALHWSHREECKHCPVLHICAGSCMYLGGDNWSRSCNNEFYTGIPIFIAAMSELAEERLVSWQGNVVRPNYEIPKTNRIAITEVD